MAEEKVAKVFFYELEEDFDFIGEENAIENIRKDKLCSIPLMSKNYESAPKKRLHPPLFSLSTYELHKRLVNNYLLLHRGSTSKLHRDTSRDKRDIDVIRDNHKFLWDATETPDSWEERLAKKYYDKLFKEYCISDLTRYKENKVAMRWRTEEEVVVGKGQFECGEKHCHEKEVLRSWEVNFGYVEKDVKKNALVKLRLCSACSTKLNYHHKKHEITATKGRKRKLQPSDEPKAGKKTTGALGIQTTDALSIQTTDVSSQTTQVSQEKEEIEERNAWKDLSTTDEKSREEEFQDYLEELLM